MKLSSKELIKLLLAKENITQKELVRQICEFTGENYTPDAFSHKLNRGTMSYDEAIMIADILGYELELKKIK